jgi:riboflavin kinase / FMN adenylyltransferase
MVDSPVSGGAEQRVAIAPRLRFTQQSLLIAPLTQPTLVAAPAAANAWLASPPPAVALAVGMFDGVHPGHRQVIAAACAAAQTLGGRAAVLTFDPHPSRILRPDQATRLLMPPVAKTERLLECGIDGVLWHPFDAAFAHLPAEHLVDYLRALLPGLRSIHIGTNFRFGYQRRGDPALLAATAARHGIAVQPIDQLIKTGAPVSSSRIREAVEAGDMAAAARLLGEPYQARGAVVAGRQLGRTIGFPTLNLDWQPEAAPPRGVYIVRVRGAAPAAVSLPAIANFGLRPTLNDGASRPILEVHVLGEVCPHTTGDQVRVDWLHFLRPEQRFAELSALQAAIGQDCAAARAWFAGA